MQSAFFLRDFDFFDVVLVDLHFHVLPVLELLRHFQLDIGSVALFFERGDVHFRLWQVCSDAKKTALKTNVLTNINCS